MNKILCSDFYKLCNLVCLESLETFLFPHKIFFIMDAFDFSVMDKYLDRARDIASDVYTEGVKQLGNKTDTDKKLMDALSSKNWGASTTELGELAQLSNSWAEFPVIMKATWKAMDSVNKVSGIVV